MACSNNKHVKSDTQSLFVLSAAIAYSPCPVDTASPCRRSPSSSVSLGQGLPSPMAFMSRAMVPSDVDAFAPQLPPDLANEVLLEGPPYVSRCNSVPDIGMIKLRSQAADALPVRYMSRL